MNDLPNNIRRMRPIAAALVLIAVAVWLLAGPLPRLLDASPLQGAQTYTVTKTADANDGACNADCSLREAIAMANTNSGPNTINIPPGTYTLTLGSLIVGSATNLNTTLNGTGTPQNTIIRQASAGNNDVIEAAQDMPLQLTIQNLTISGGSFGGIVTGCCSPDPGVSSTTIVNCIIDGNTDPDIDMGGQGGGILNQFGNLTIQNSTISNNQALGATQGQGGGVYFMLNDSSAGSIGDLAIVNTTFSNNQAAYQGTEGAGGAIYIQGNTVTTNTYTISNSTFISNRATDGTDGRGGAVVVAGGTVVLNNNRIVSNTATTAGGIYQATAGSATATNNWWGCNFGPGATGAGCAATTNGTSGTVTSNPWLVLSVTPVSSSVTIPATTTVSASVTKNSASASGFRIPDGVTTTFSGTLGAVSPASATTSNGADSTVFTAGGTAGAGSAIAIVDGQTISTSITIQQATTTYADDAYIGSSDNQNLGAGLYFNRNAFGTIQGAANAVASGGTLYVGTGTYTETVNIAQSETVIINGAVTLNGNATLSQGTLTLNNDLNMRNNVLTLGASTGTSGTGDVVGQVSRSGFATGTKYNFGNPDVAITFGNTSTVPSNVIINLSKSAPGTFTQAINRTYAITPTGGTYSATLRLHYTDAELNSNTEAGLDLWRHNVALGAWTRFPKTASDTTANWAQRSGLTAFSEWTLSSSAAGPTAVTLVRMNATETDSGNAWLSLGAVIPVAVFIISTKMLRKRKQRTA